MLSIQGSGFQDRRKMAGCVAQIGRPPRRSEPGFTQPAASPNSAQSRKPLRLPHVRNHVGQAWTCPPSTSPSTALEPSKHHWFIGSKTPCSRTEPLQSFHVDPFPPYKPSPFRRFPCPERRHVQATAPSAQTHTVGVATSTEAGLHRCLAEGAHVRRCGRHRVTHATFVFLGRGEASGRVTQAARVRLFSVWLNPNTEHHLKRTAFAFEPCVARINLNSDELPGVFFRTWTVDMDISSINPTQATQEERARTDGCSNMTIQILYIEQVVVVWEVPSIELLFRF